MEIKGTILKKDFWFYERDDKYHGAIKLTIETVYNDHITCLAFKGYAEQINEAFQENFVVKIQGKPKLNERTKENDYFIDKIENIAYVGTNLAELIANLNSIFEATNYKIEKGIKIREDLINEEKILPENEFAGQFKYYNELLSQLDELSNRTKLAYDLLSFKCRWKLTEYEKEVSLVYDDHANFLAERYKLPLQESKL